MIFESYAQQGVNLANNFLDVITAPTQRQEFMDTLTESFTSDPMFTDSKCSKAAFYDNYADRFQALANNSLNEVAQEAVMQGYAPIVAYNPFFLKEAMGAAFLS